MCAPIGTRRRAIAPASSWRSTRCRWCGIPPRRDRGARVPEIAELDLPHLAMEQDWFAADPAPQFAAARAQHPWLATSIYGYVVTSFPAMRELVAMEAKVLRTAYDEMVESMGAL